MGKGFYQAFKNVVKEITQELPPLGESGSEVSHFIPKLRNFAEVTKLSYDIKKPWLKENMKEVNNLINNQNFIAEDPEKNELVTPCMDFYKDKIQSDGIIDKLKLIIVVIGDLHNKKLVKDTWSPTESMRALKYFLADTTKTRKELINYI